MASNPLGLKLNRITARVRDIDRAVAWYQDMLGFSVGERGVKPGGRVKYAYLHLAEVGVSLVQVDVPTAEVPPGLQPLPCWLHPVFEVADPQSTFEALRARGADASTRGGGVGPVTSFLITDSEGNQIEIIGASR